MKEHRKNKASDSFGDNSSLTLGQHIEAGSSTGREPPLLSVTFKMLFVAYARLPVESCYALDLHRTSMRMPLKAKSATGELLEDELRKERRSI